MFTLPENPYDVLGVSKNAQLPEIRSAHRKLVLKCHPDKVTDPALKAAKQEEFQKVQKAYEMLSDENERQKYDDMVMANELERDNAERRRQRDRDQFTPGRTPPRYEPDYRPSPHYSVHIKDPGYNVRNADPPPFSKSSTFPSSKSPYGSTRTPPRSFEDNIHYTTSYEEVPRESRKSKKPSVVYEKEIRHEDERRRKKVDDEWERAQEKSKRKEMERKEQERKEQERTKERRKEDKKKVDKERKRDSDEKRSRHKSPYMEEAEEVIYNPPPPKAEKKSKSSSRSRHETTVRAGSPPPLPTDRDKKHKDHLNFAAQYLETSRARIPGMQRAQTYHYNVRDSSPPPPAVATPPPAAAGVAPPPPMYADIDETLRRSTRRRMSHDSPRVKEKSSSHKKSSSSREQVDPVRIPLKKSNTMPTTHSGTPPNVPESPPRYTRPIPQPIPSMARAATWMPGDDPRDRSRSRHARHYSDDESEEEVRHSRRSRRTRSPDDAQRVTTSRYTVQNGRTVVDRTGSYGDDSPIGRRSKPSYYVMGEGGRPLEHRPSPHSHDSYGPAQVFDRVKTSKHINLEDVSYSGVNHTAESPYRPEVYAAY